MIERTTRKWFSLSSEYRVLCTLYIVPSSLFWGIVPLSLFFGVVGLYGLGLDDDRGVTSLQVLRLIGNDPRHIAGGQTENQFDWKYYIILKKSQNNMYVSEKSDSCISEHRIHLFVHYTSQCYATYHGGSCRQLLGEQPSAEQIESWSLDKQVSGATPPCWLIACQDDPTVPVENSIRFYQALTAYKVPSTMLLVPTGGHGWGFTHHFPMREVMEQSMMSFITSFQ